MTASRMSRRRLLVTAGGGVVAGSVVAANFGASEGATTTGRVGPFRGVLPDGTQLLSGTIQEIQPPSLLTLRGSHPPTEVRLKPGARLWRDRIVSLNEFRSGDEVTAYGTWSGQAFSAHRLEPTYQKVEGDVIRRDGDLLITSGGTVRVAETAMRVLHDGQVAPVRAEDFSPGERLSIGVRLEPGEDHLLAVRFSSGAID